jgi:hypothetical protein
MTPELKATWIEALRSGKYKQGREYLYRSNGEFCCLGVLCDVLDPTDWRKSEVTDTAFTYRRSSSWAPASVIDELDQGKLIAMNDDQLASFDEIADYIEYYL